MQFLKSISNLSSSSLALEFVQSKDIINKIEADIENSRIESVILR